MACFPPLFSASSLDFGKRHAETAQPYTHEEAMHRLPSQSMATISLLTFKIRASEGL